MRSESGKDVLASPTGRFASMITTAVWFGAAFVIGWEYPVARAACVTSAVVYVIALAASMEGATPHNRRNRVIRVISWVVAVAGSLGGASILISRFLERGPYPAEILALGLLLSAPGMGVLGSAFRGASQ